MMGKKANLNLILGALVVVLLVGLVYFATQPRSELTGAFLEEHPEAILDEEFQVAKFDTQEMVADKAVRIRGGASRMTWSPMALTSRPASRQRPSTAFAIGSARTTPSSNPRPRTCLTPG